MLMVVNPPLGRFNRWMSLCLSKMQGGSRLLLGALLGGMMATDYGGPINKAAYVSGTLALVDLQYDLMAAVMAGGMVPPLGLALACMLFPTRFTASERRSVPQTAIMGLSFVTEGALPFRPARPAACRPLLYCRQCTGRLFGHLPRLQMPRPHGGLFLLPVMGNPLGFLGALLGGSLLAALLLGLLKKAAQTIIMYSTKPRCALRMAGLYAILEYICDFLRARRTLPLWNRSELSAGATAACLWRQPIF